MTKTKIYTNALLLENLTKLTPKDKQTIIKELTKNKTERQLSKELNIPRSTINDWKTLRQNNTGKNLHVSLSVIYRKLKELKPTDISDWGRIEQIKETCEKLLQQKQREVTG